MLIPQFSIRWMFGLTAVMGVVFVIMRWAVLGSIWAIGVSAAVVALAVLALVYAGMFALVWLIGVSGSRIKSRGQELSPKEIH